MAVGTSSRASWRRKIGGVLTPVLFAGLLTLVIASLQSISTEGGLAGLERQALGWMFVHRPSRPADERIEFVAVDTPLYERTEALNLPPSTPPGEKLLEEYQREDCDFPVPREVYAMALERLTNWGAQAVVLDIMFSRRGYSPGDQAADMRLGDAMFDANNVVAAAVMRALALDRSRDPTITSDVLLNPPCPAVADNAYIGSPKIDPRDQEYAFELLQTAHSSDGFMEDYFSMPYLAYCLSAGLAPEEMERWEGKWIEGTAPRLMGRLFTRTTPQPTPADEGGPGTAGNLGEVELIIEGNVTLDEAFYRKRLIINYSTGADPAEGRFVPSRLTWLLTCSDEEGRERYGNKIVLIGDPATDLHRTVVGAMPGTEVLANAVQTLLQDRPIVPASNHYVLLLMFAGSLAAALAVRQFSASLAFLIVGGEIAGLGYLSLQLLQYDVWLLTATPVAAIAGAAGMAFFAESRVGQGMVARLIPERISRTLEHAGGFQVAEGTVMFSDIRGYSTFSEYMDPAEMMTRLNDYFGSVNDVLDRYDGHFIKSPGDCVVAWFSEERHGEHHAERAIRAAIEMVMNAIRQRENWPSLDGQEFNIGVGINTGEMAVGMLDTRRHLEPTVIGDTVNLAARVEGLTKEYGAALIVTEDTLNPVRESFLYESLGETTVKGREQPVRLFAIIGVHPDAAVETKSRWWKRGEKPRSREALYFRVPELSAKPINQASRSAADDESELAAEAPVKEEDLAGAARD